MELLLNHLSFIISITGLIVGLISFFQTIIINKDENLQLIKTKKKLHESINLINQIATLDTDALSNEKPSKDDFKMVLYWYCNLIIDTLRDLYPKYDFSISIKKISDDSVYTLLQAGENLFIDEKSQLIKDNTEFSTIINNGYNYFFVTDLNSFNKKINMYSSSDLEWKYKYNTSIVFPIKKIDAPNSKPVGFICVNSPQVLQKRKINDYLIKLLEETRNSLYEVLQQL